MIKASKRLKKAVYLSRSNATTIRVEILRTICHPRYKKYVKRTKILLVHAPDDLNYKRGDEILIKSCRRISKCKSHFVYNRQEQS